MEIISSQSLFLWLFSDGKLPAYASSRAGDLPVWVVKPLDSMETLGREISNRHALCTVEL